MSDPHLQPNRRPTNAAVSSSCSDSVDGNVDLEAGVGVRQEYADVVLEEVSDPVELHDVPRLLAEPELVELDEEEGVEVVEVLDGRSAALGDVEDVALGGAVREEAVSHVRDVDADDGEGIPATQGNKVILRTAVIAFKPVQKRFRMHVVEDER